MQSNMQRQKEEKDCLVKKYRETQHRDTKRYEERFEGDGYGYYFDCDSFMMYTYINIYYILYTKKLA